MAPHLSQTIVLRLLAFLVDALTTALALMLPSSLVSYGIVLFANGSIKAIAIVWDTALLILALVILLRDGWKGRSPGKRMLGLVVKTASGKDCSYGRSIVRNLPLVIPGWNLVELYLVLFSSSGLRTGDRIARTHVAEE